MEQPSFTIRFSFRADTPADYRPHPVPAAFQKFESGTSLIITWRPVNDNDVIDGAGVDDGPSCKKVACGFSRLFYTRICHEIFVRETVK